MKNYFKPIILSIALASLLPSCNDFLDREPLSDITPEVFFNNEGDLAAYTISRYSFPTNAGYNAGTFTSDNGTDNQAGPSASVVWAPGLWKVETTGGVWSFGQIRQLNYFLNTVEPKVAEGKVAGNATNIQHYIGEAYFLRAYEYFNKLSSLGDFPIITETLNDDAEVLKEASKRRPRNEVARFILEDLDKAISMLKSGPVANKNRISKEVALLFKSRVALFEGTWEKYHQGTAFVPGGPGWPGAQKDYLSNYNVNLNTEINFFLSQAMEAAKAVADATPLTANDHAKIYDKNVFTNSYFEMFSDFSMAGYSEVLLWRDYDAGIGVVHRTQKYLGIGGASTGYTRSLVQSFLMKNGLPIYASGSGYQGDTTLSEVRQDRDERLQLFLAVPGDDLSADPSDTLHLVKTPNILDIPEQRAVTGYMVKKGVGGNAKYYSSSFDSENGSLVFRATEAYLNYIEAAYVKNGSLDGTATSYWGALRQRAGLPANFNMTISATDLSQERDWAKYSHGQLIDKTLYNIRRERRNELIAEGFRYNDLRRWRALDQVKNYQIEGFNLWEQMYNNYTDGSGASMLRAEPTANPNVSPKTNSTYLRPYQIVSSNNEFYNGYKFTAAHYLYPIAFHHFLLTSDGNVNNSVIYQNPGWPIEAGGIPTTN